MKNIKIQGYHGTFYVPSVDFNAETGICKLEGESYLEETNSFYEPLIKWLDEFLTKNDKKLVFNIKLEYYNTSSSKCIVDMLRVLSKYQKAGKDVVVNWYYDNKSEDVEEEIEEVEDFMLETGIKINLVPIYPEK